MNARLALGFAVFLALASACQNRARKEESAPSSPSTVTTEAKVHSSIEAPSLARSGEPGVGALPEDPEAGERSVEQWREHLREEERERRRGYDRRRQRQHREVIQRLREIRRSSTAATSERAIRGVQEQLRASTPKLEKQFDAIDHWRVSSTLVPEYAKLVEIFSAPYPEARVAALSGEKAQLEAIEKDIAARFEHIDDELREALESEDE